jgi:chromosome partitioning protein
MLPKFVKAIRLVRAQEKAFSKKIPFSILFTRTSAAIRPRTLQSIESEFGKQEVPMFDVQIHERETYRAIFAFGGSLTGLDSTQVSNLPAAINNARIFAAEVISKLMASKPKSKAEQVA